MSRLGSAPASGVAGTANRTAAHGEDRDRQAERGGDLRTALVRKQRLLAAFPLASVPLSCVNTVGAWLFTRL
jgi:hypothetical protein